VIADDVAFYQGPLAAPETLRRFFFPSLARQTEACRNAGLAVFFHSDGDLNLLLDDIAAAGVDGLHCIEETAGMDLARVKNQHGEQLCLWGNLDPDWLTAKRDSKDIVDKVTQILHIGQTGGGFIFGTSSGLFKPMIPGQVELTYDTVHRFSPSGGGFD